MNLPNPDIAAKVLADKVSQYAAKKGPEWRLGEGTEVMTALLAYNETLRAYKLRMLEYAQKLIQESHGSSL
jgi:hypothetical protein